MLLRNRRADGLQNLDFMAFSWVTYFMIYPSELSVYLQSDVGQVLILLSILERRVELHMEGMDSEDNIANALKEEINQDCQIETIRKIVP